jgi:CRP-like cAMP-binding protein
MKDIFKSYLNTNYRITDDTAEIIFSLLTPKKIKRGTILLKQGEYHPYIFFVTSGCLRSYIIDKRGKTHTLGFAPEKWWLGDHFSLLRKEPAMFSIDAVEDTELLMADQYFFEKMPAIYDGFHGQCLRHLAKHTRIMEKRILSLLGAYGDEQYVNFMMTYPELTLRLRQSMIASYLGISRESLSRIRSKLAQHRSSAG